MLVAGRVGDVVDSPSFEVTEKIPYEIPEMRNYDRNLVMAQIEDAKETPHNWVHLFIKG